MSWIGEWQSKALDRIADGELENEPIILSRILSPDVAHAELDIAADITGKLEEVLLVRNPGLRPTNVWATDFGYANERVVEASTMTGLPMAAFLNRGCSLLQVGGGSGVVVDHCCCR